MLSQLMPAGFTAGEGVPLPTDSSTLWLPALWDKVCSADVETTGVGSKHDSGEHEGCAAGSL